MPRRRSFWTVSLVVLICAAACRSVAAPAPETPTVAPPEPRPSRAPTPTPSAVQTVPTVVQPLPSAPQSTPSGLQAPRTLTSPREQCDDLRQQVKAALRTNLEPQAGPLDFTVRSTSTSVLGCSVSVEGTFAEFPIGRLEPISAMLLAQGFVRAPYPTAIVNAEPDRYTAFRRGDQMMTLDLSYDWSAPCPASRLFMECSGHTARVGWYQEPLAAPKASPSSPQPAPSYIQEGCAALGQQLLAALGTGLPVSALIETTSEWHLVESAPTIGCTVSVKGLQAGNFPNGATGPLAAMLLAQGFERDDRFSADGPNGNARGYRKGYEVRILSYSWQVPPESCVHIGFNCYAPPEVTVITLGMRWYQL